MNKVGALLLLVALATSACDSTADVSGGDGVSTVPAPADLARICPPWDAPIRYAEGDLPEGAQSVRLCPGPPIVGKDGTIFDVGIQPPEVLTTQVEDLVDVVNSLESAPEDIACPADGGPRLTYWFSYNDGDARVVPPPVPG